MTAYLEVSKCIHFNPEVTIDKCKVKTFKLKSKKCKHLYTILQ